MKEENLERGLEEQTAPADGGYPAIWHQFRENTTAHGIPHITNASGRFILIVNPKIRAFIL